MDKFDQDIFRVLSYQPVSWSDIDWYLIKNYIKNIQIKIYESVKTGVDYHFMQEELIDDGVAKLLATLRITQENKGKRSPGVDGQSSKTITNRIIFAKSLEIDGLASRIRRVWIPKPGKTEKRPLGVPTIKDRAKQFLIKLALEPEWEAKFERHSYGFRPGRAPRDAITQVLNSIKQSEKFILDADIKKCFDRINHKKLINKLGSIDRINNQINAWLKAGIMDNINQELIDKNPSGTPQGGIISPLLCNIALHGMYDACLQGLKDYHVLEAQKPGKYQFKRLTISMITKLGFVRFADDFLVLHPEELALICIKDRLDLFLADINLEFSNEKTKIVHLLNKHNGHNAGVTFLGFRVFQFRTKKRSAKIRNITLGFKTRIIPDEKNRSQHLNKLKFILKKMRGQSQLEVIKTLNPIINGWSNYYRHSHATDTFGFLDHRLFKLLQSWCLHRHRNKGKTWIYDKYFGKIGKRKWTFRYIYLDIPWLQLSNHFRKIESYKKN